MRLDGTGTTTRERQTLGQYHKKSLTLCVGAHTSVHRIALLDGGIMASSLLTNLSCRLSLGASSSSQARGTSRHIIAGGNGPHSWSRGCRALGVDAAFAVGIQDNGCRQSITYLVILEKWWLGRRYCTIHHSCLETCVFTACSEQ